MFVVVQPPALLSSQRAVKHQLGTVVKTFLCCSESERGDLRLDADQSLSPLSHRWIEGSCKDPVFSRPEKVKDGSLIVLYQASRGVKAISLSRQLNYWQLELFLYMTAGVATITI